MRAQELLFASFRFMARAFALVFTRLKRADGNVADLERNAEAVEMSATARVFGLICAPLLHIVSFVKRWLPVF
ncbi:uncharacterized protein V1518DRAFT_50348 [Limtongia smithiae]|uniref:uncharacterized protein n=1 Tax=Limtongia smithiae TaxID=1125753 RepID=UPI0034CF5700